MIKSYKHRMKKRVFQNGNYREVVVHTNDDINTGKLGKNDVEIYENDKVKDYDGNEHIVTYKDAMFYIGQVPLGTFEDGELEVIGHHWEN